MLAVAEYWTVIIVLSSCIAQTSALIEGLYCGKEICYDVLNVTRDSSKSEITKAYRKLAREFHPDRIKGGAEAKKAAEQRFTIIATAYETLKDDEARADYDYMLDNPEALYYHYYHYYRRRMAPKVDVRIVIVGALIAVSVVQYVSSWHKYNEAINYLLSEPKYRLKAVQTAKERGLLGNIESSKKGKRRQEKEELKSKEEAILKEILEENMDIKGGYSRPKLIDLVMFQVFLLPWYLVQLIWFYLSWFIKFTLLRNEYGEEEKVYLIRRYLKLSEAQFSSLPEKEIDSYLRQELWMWPKFKVWKEVKDEEMRQKQLESASYKSLLSGYSDGSVVIFNLNANMCHPNQKIETVAKVSGKSKYAHSHCVTCVQWYPFDHGLFITGAMDRELRVWEPNRMKPVDSFTFESPLNCVAMPTVSSKRFLIAVGTSLSDVYLVNVATGSKLQRLHGHEQSVLSAQYSPRDSNILVSSGLDGQILVWDIRSGKLVKESARNVHLGPRAHKTGVSSVKFTPDGLFLVSRGRDGRLKLWDMVTLEQNVSTKFAKSAQLDDGFSTYSQPHGKKGRTDIVLSYQGHGDEVVYAPQGENIGIWNLFSGALIGTLNGHLSKVNCLAYREGVYQELYSGASDRNILIWVPPMDQNDAYVEERKGLSRKVYEDSWSDDEIL